MPQQIEITNVNGVGPYQVKVCDITNTTCVTITGATYIPPSFTFLTPPPFENVESLLIKIIDSTGCETFQYYSCPTTPTPTPTPSPCVYSEWEIKLGGPCTFDLYDCDYNVYDTVTFPISGTYYVCSVYQPTSAGICALPPTIPNVGPCTP